MSVTLGRIMAITLSLNEYIPRDIFQIWKEAVRKIANWNPIDRVWEISPQKVLRLSVCETVKVYEVLKELGTSVIVQGKEGDADALWNILFPVGDKGSWDKLPEGVIWKPPFFAFPLDEDGIEKLLRYMNDQYLPPEKRLASPSGECATAVCFKDLGVEKNRFSCSYTAERIPPSTTAYVLKGKLAEAMKIAEEGNPENIVWRYSWADEVPDPQAYSPIPLRPYQRDAVVKTIEVVGKRGGAVIRAPTGSGKTVMAVALFRELRALGLVKRAVFLAHTRDLVLQGAEFFKNLSSGEYSVGIITGEEAHVGDITALSVQTALKAVIVSVYGGTKNEKLEKALKALNGADLVIVDEAHHVPSMTFKGVLTYLIGKPIVGLSATPWREDGLEPYLYGFIGPLSFSISLESLKEMGYIAGAELYIVRPEWELPPDVYAKIEEAKMKINDEGLFYRKRWNIVSSWLASSNPKRRELIVKIAEKVPKPALILVDRVSEASKLAEELKKAGLSAVAVTGALKGHERKRFIDMLKEGKLDVIVATKLADEGLDIPQLRSLIIATLGKSSTKFPQRVGRALRKIEGKSLAVVVDIADKVLMPNGSPYPALENHFKRRLSIYKTELGGRAVKVVENSGELLRKLEEKRS